MDKYRFSARLGFVLLSLLGTGAAASAQGETGFFRGKGKADIVLSYSVDTYDEFWVGGNKVAMPGVGEVNRDAYLLYGAYGLRDDIDLIVAGAYVETESDGAAGAPDEEEFQDLLVAVKARLLHRQYGWGEASLSVVPGIKVPLTDYEDNAITAVGDGQVDLRARVVAHVQSNRGLFASFETGYDRRNGKPDNEIPFHLTLGATIANRLTVAPFYSTVDSQGGTNIGPPGTNDFPTNEEDYTRTGVSAYLRVTDRFGVTGSWRTTLDGSNTGDVDGFSVGVVYRLN